MANSLMRLGLKLAWLSVWVMPEEVKTSNF
jgi:hypothetical protein